MGIKDIDKIAEAAGVDNSENNEPGENETSNEDENGEDKEVEKEIKDKPSDDIKDIIEEEAGDEFSADDCCVCPCCCCCFCTCRKKRKRRRRELLSAFIRRRTSSQGELPDPDTWSTNNVRRDIYYEEYQR